MLFGEFTSSKGNAHVLRDDSYYMRMAIAEAERSKFKGDIPIGSVILLNDSKFIVSHDTTFSEFNLLKTSVCNVLESANNLSPNRMADSVLYTTLEPDALSILAACKYGINEVLFGAYNLKDGFISSRKVVDVDLYEVHYKGGILAEECFKILPDNAKEYASIEKPDDIDK